MHGRIRTVLSLVVAAVVAPPIALAADAPAPHLFATSDRCLACHNGMATSAGEDLSIGVAWRASIMANASRDPYWHASVRREVMEHPASAPQIEDECAACHMPMARTQAVASGGQGQIFAHLPPAAHGSPGDREALDGVSCSLCHQLQNQGPALQHNGELVIDRLRPWGQRLIYGPYDVPREHTRIMQSSSSFAPQRAGNMEQSELCSTCHTLYTTALGANGQALGQFPEQVPYLEWQHSAFVKEKTCQACHMTFTAEPAPATSVLGEPRPNFARHGFQGANFFMLGMLNRYRGELGVAAQPEELQASRLRTLQLLRDETATVAVARAQVAHGRLDMEVVVTNVAGHKLPTAYPSRRAWLHVEVRDAKGNVLFSSGALRPDGSIEGNDNDRDPLAFEPHHRVVETSEQVQIYEAILLDSQSKVTTGLISAVRYAKDNRLLPRGLDKRSAGDDFAVRGQAFDDPDFQGGSDHVLYQPLLSAGGAGDLQVHVDLLYQPIGSRWAHNLARKHSATEPARFLGYYTAMSGSSATTLAQVTVPVSP